MTDGIISSVLSSIFSREAEAVRAGSLLRKGIMNEVNIARSPLLIVLDETAVEVAARQIICRVLIEA
jgi:hypothetical protein